MSIEVIGNKPEQLVKTFRQKQPPEWFISQSEWNAWTSEASTHEYLHTLPSQHHIETMSVIWEFGVITTAVALQYPEVINDTYLVMRQTYFELITAAFVQPTGGFGQLTPEVIKESAKIVGGEMSDPDWQMWKMANDESVRQDWIETITSPPEFNDNTDTTQNYINQSGESPNEKEPNQSDSTPTNAIPPWSDHSPADEEQYPYNEEGISDPLSQDTKDDPQDQINSEEPIEGEILFNPSATSQVIYQQ